MDKLEGVVITPLKIIENQKGSIYHVLKNTDSSYLGFGEAYFSEVKFGEKKGWKKHLKMTLNLIVPFGSIRFVLYDDRPNSKTKSNYFEVVLGSQKETYQRLTIPPNIWVAFEGVGPEINMVLNIANIPHDPLEAIGLTLMELRYDW